MKEETEPLGKRIGRFIVLMGIVFAIAAGIMVTQRLSKDSLALLIGLSCGIAAMLPTIGVFVLWFRREESRRQEIPLERSTQSQPQIIVVAPQSLPGYNTSYPSEAQPALPSQWQTSATQREFKIVGGRD